MSNLEACGGCPGREGVDCSTLSHLSDMACVDGKCVGAAMLVVEQ